MTAVVPRINLSHLVARHLIGLLAASQASVAVMLHAGWVFLLLGALLIPQDPSAPAATTQWLGRALLRALEWIGALERNGGHGHADLDTVARGLATLAPVIYLGQLLIGYLRRGRPAWSIKRKALLSMAIAALGYGVALVLLPDGAWSGLWVAGVIAVLLTFVATLWALLVRRGCDALVRALDR